MKKLVLRLFILSILTTGVVGSANLFAQDHDAVTDSLSIDDMDPILYSDDAEEEEKESSNGVIIGAVIAVAVVAGVGIKMFGKKKK